MNETGKPQHFNLAAYIETINGLINSDEVERALWLIDNPPAYYRDNPPDELVLLKERLHRQLWTPIQYRGIYDALEGQEIAEYWPLRAQVLEREVKAFNEKGIVPTVCELAPGGLFLSKNLRKLDRKHFYKFMSLDESDLEIEANERKDSVIFCAFELIEHLSNPFEIYQNYLKFEREAEIILLSTPLYTYGGGMDRWQERELGHLRAYTPREFHECAARMFAGYKWECVTDDTIVLVGRKI